MIPFVSEKATKKAIQNMAEKKPFKSAALRLAVKEAAKRTIHTPVEDGVYGREADPDLLIFERKVRSPHIVEYRKLEKVRKIRTPKGRKTTVPKTAIKKAVKTVKAMKKTTHKNDPGHYTECTIEPIEFVLANNLGACEANVVKYVCRWKQKDGIEDLRKAIRYLELLIEHENYKGKAKKR